MRGTPRWSRAAARSWCGRGVVGRGWEVTLPGTPDTVFVPFASGTIPLCSNPDLSISTISQFLPPGD